MEQEGERKTADKKVISESSVLSLVSLSSVPRTVPAQPAMPGALPVSIWHRQIREFLESMLEVCRDGVLISAIMVAAAMTVIE